MFSKSKRGHRALLFDKTIYLWNFQTLKESFSANNAKRSFIISLKTIKF